MNAPKSRIPVLLVLLALTIALAVWVWWSKSGHEAVTSQVQVVQPIATPAPQEAVGQIEPQQQQPAETPVATVTPEPRKYVVVSGDKLMVRFGKNAAKVCELNKNKLKDCNRIYPGQDLLVPDDMEIVGRKPVQRLTDGSLPIARLAVDPYRPHRTPEKDRKILAGQGYTSAEIAEYLVLRDQGKCAREDFSRGTKFPWMSSGNARVLENLVAVWKQPEAGLVCQLQSGRNVVIMEKCDNLTEVAPRPPKTIAPPSVEPKLPPREETPEEPPVTPPQQPDEPVVEESWCPSDIKLVFGGENEPRHDGNKAESLYATGAMYCTWRGVDSTHGLGAGFQASKWDVLVNHGVGEAKGYLAAGGPAYERIWDDGRDMEAKLLFGRLDERFSQDQYQSRRVFDIAGVSVGHNDYQRRMRGETWFTETQYHGVLAFPLSKSVSHSWAGQSIKDTSELGEFKAYFNAGVRKWIYDDGKLPAWYVQAGYFLEDPTAESMSLRVGIADPNRICGIGIGPDYDLKHGGEAKAWGWWCDPVMGAQVARDKHRMDQLIEKGDVTVANGIIMVPLDD